MNIFQIPSLDKSANDYTIGVVDCSGSMEGNWSWLADHWNKFIPIESSSIITFDTKAKIPASNRLETDIYRHGGGGTNITAGFVKLDEQLAKLPPKSNVTIIFISDGEDNNQNTLAARMSELEGNDGSRRINFICIGVGPGFPTFISMKLREKYHNGDETLPAIFLIEHVSEKAYTIKFEAIRPFLTVGQVRTVNPPVCVFPWREYTGKVFERTWVMTDADSIELDGEKVDLRPYHLNLRGINELFRSWNQMINLESLNEGEKVDLRAKKTLALMDSILEELKEVKGIDVFAKPKDLKFNSIYDRFQIIVNKRNFERTVWYYDDVKKIAAGDTAGQLSSFEAAKRIGLGTIVGKYAQKTFALKNITPEEFEAIKDEFKKLLETHKVAPKENGHAFRKVLTEETLPKALDLVKNQLELFETFPFHGHPVRIIRNDQGQINPQDVDLRYLATHQTVELVDITSEQGGSISVQTEDGKQETANAVVPLFGPEDADLVPFINSRLYKLLLSWSLVRDPDTLLDESFSCLLTAVFKYALTSAKADPALAEKAATNLALVRSSHSEGDLFRNTPTDLNSAIKELDLEKKHRTASLTKILLNAFSHAKTGSIDPELLKNLLLWAQVVSIKSLIAGDVSKLKKLFALEIKKNETEESPQERVGKKVRALFPQIRSMGDLARKLAALITDLTLNADVEIHYQADKLEKLAEGHADFLLVTRLRELLKLPQVSAEESEALVLAAYQSRSEGSDEVDVANLSDVSASKTAVTVALKEELKKTQESSSSAGKKGKKGKAAPKPTTGPKLKDLTNNPLFKELLPGLQTEFQEFFKQIHREVIPLSPEELADFAKNKKVNVSNIKFNSSTHLPIRTCAAQGCHFFMRNMPRLDSHLRVWGVKLPQGFHLIVKNNREKSTKEIYEIFAKDHFTTVDGHTVPFDPKRFDKSEAEVLEYIDKLRVAYNKFP